MRRAMFRSDPVRPILFSVIPNEAEGSQVIRPPLPVQTKNARMSRLIGWRAPALVQFHGLARDGMTITK